MKDLILKISKRFYLAYLDLLSTSLIYLRLRYRQTASEVIIYPESLEIQNYWFGVARHIRNKYFSDPENFFNDSVVKNHIANPDFMMGEIIVKKLFTTEYGKKITRLYSDSSHCNPILMPQFPSISPTSATHMMNLFLINEKLGIDLMDHKKIKIIDFGGGYGGFARLLLTLNQHIHVAIIDIDEMLQVQKDFINKTMNANNRLFLARSVDEVPIPIDSITLFNATYSLSESSIVQRELCKTYIKNQCDMFFIVYQKDFLGIDNDNYMKLMSNDLSDKFDIKWDVYGDWMNQDDARVIYGRKK